MDSLRKMAEECAGRLDYGASNKVRADVIERYLARAAAGALREAAEAHGDVCESCHRPKATDDDWERYGEGEGEHLCWGGCVFLGRTVAGWLRERAAALDARGDENESD